VFKMTRTQQIMQVEGIDELLDADYGESLSMGNSNLSEEAECVDDLFYEKIASSALIFSKARG